MELFRGTVLQWIDSCETDTQLDTCRRFIEQKKEQLKDEVVPGLFENIENAMVNKSMSVKLTV
jgi:hypothetical protein